MPAYKTSKSLTLVHYARAAIFATLMTSAVAALAGPITIVDNPTGGVNSHINVNGTNWGGTTFFDVNNLSITDFGNYQHTKNDNGNALGEATVNISAPDANSTNLNIQKSGFANVGGGGAWSNVQGAIYFDIATNATYTAAHQILAGSNTKYQFSFKKYNTNARAFDMVFGTESATQVGPADFSPYGGSLSSGIYEFYWASRNNGPYVGGSSFAHDFQLGLQAEALPQSANAPEPATLMLLAIGLSGIGFCKRKVT